MRAGKRRQTETKQTRSCNVVLKKLSDKFITPIRSTLRSSKVTALTADITETQNKKVQNKNKGIALKPQTLVQPNRFSAKTPLTPAAVKQTPSSYKASEVTLKANPNLRKKPDQVVTRRSTIVAIEDEEKPSFLTPKVASVSVRLPKFRRNSVATTVVAKKTPDVNTASTSKAALTAALRSAARNANFGLQRTGVRLESQAKTKSNTKPIVKVDTKPNSSSKATEYRKDNKGEDKLIAKSEEKLDSSLIAANSATSQAMSLASKSKMYKQTKLVTISSNTQMPPTIAASRSRRSIKPNPKYASEDIVTPKYVTALASDSAHSRRSHARVNDDRFADSGDDFFNRETDDFIDDDNDDDIADEAFDPRTQNSDEDLSDLEIYNNDHVVHPKRRGRPGKAVQVATPGRHAKSSSSLGQQRSGVKTAPTQLQQLRRTMALSVPRVSATPGANKRKLDDNDKGGNSEVPRKRLVVATAVSGAKSSLVTGISDGKRVVMRRSLPLVNGANKSSASGTSTAVGAKVLAGSRPSISSQGTTAMKPARATTMYQVSAKAEKHTATMGRLNASSAKPIKTTMAKPPTKDSEGGKSSSAGDNTHTFTIVNIDDIINQDDVLISKTVGQHVARKQANAKSSSGDAVSAARAARANSTAVCDGGVQAKRQPFATRTLTATKQLVQANKSVSNPKPAPRILNSEVGKRTQSMKPLMNMVDDMAKDLRPVMPSGEAEGDSDLDDDDILDDEIANTPPTPAKMPPRRTIYRNAVTPTGIRAIEAKKVSGGTGIVTSTQTNQKRRLASLLCDDEENTTPFKKPEAKENSLAATNQRATSAFTKQQKMSPVVSAGADILTTVSKTQHQQNAQLPPESTTVRCEGGRVIRKITCYETWYVISVAKELPYVTRSFLEIPLVKLANVVNRIKMPTSRWSSKVTLYKLSPSSMAKQSVVIYTGDLKSHNVPETERHKYQPSCVLFRRAVTDRNQVRLPYDRAIIFKNKSFYTNIEGKHVSLVGAPESITNAKEVETLLEIIDSLTLKSSLVDLITLK